MRSTAWAFRGNALVSNLWIIAFDWRVVRSRCSTDPLAVPAGTVGDFIDDVPEGSVIAIDNGGRENATVWGDILTMVAHGRGIAGTVIDGACRDTNLSREIGYPIFSRSYSMRTGKDRVQLEATNGPVNIRDARVLAGEI